MQAHQNPTHHTIVSLLTLTLCSLALWGTGCNSSEQTEYRQYSEQVDAKSPAEEETTDNAPDQVASVEQQQSEPAPETITQTSAVKPAKPLPTETSPRPDATPAELNSSSQPATDDSLPLVAQRPDPSRRALTKEEQQAATQEPREVKILVKNKSFRHISPGNALQVSYDDIDLLKVMNMEPVTPEAPQLMPEWLKNLDGKRIRIRGFMYPPFQQSGNEYFLLARDNQICCFGKNPKIYDLFPVVLKDGVTTDYILNRPFDVVGVFHIKAETIDGELERIYLIDDAIVIDQ
ncbi:hypothetical protein Pan153_03440 [Gimesia panareensis]|uniref:DUF3299 domain-containing protein n=1 Tax=Gimesia panareensis TaxID=2527978 RepID=A0A518FHA2_9PLAN|nr:hypothetical protein [Gimesia panareensis]QDV15726.1 hypothetical protein Pan153_03440 [Gimesia panareensis]